MTSLSRGMAARSLSPSVPPTDQALHDNSYKTKLDHFIGLTFKVNTSFWKFVWCVCVCVYDFKEKFVAENDIGTYNFALTLVWHHPLRRDNVILLFQSVSLPFAQSW